MRAKNLGWLCVLLSGCGHYALPGPTSKVVTAADLVGAWRMDLTGPARTVTITFDPGGTYAEAISQGGGPVRECPGGTWRLEGPYVDLKGYVSAGTGETFPTRWYFVGDPPFLFGGDHPDPDSFWPMTKVSPPSAR